MKQYALYKGDEFLEIGTRQELAEYLGVTITTIDYYKSKAWLERSNYKSYVLVKLNDNEDEEA
jgi:hypothetical protein